MKAKTILVLGALAAGAYFLIFKKKDEVQNDIPLSAPPFAAEPAPPVQQPAPVSPTKPSTWVEAAPSSSGIAVRWERGSSATPNDWVGVFPVGAANAAYGAWSYVGSGTQVPGATKASGSISLSRPKVSGTYEVRYFSKGYELLAKSASFMV